MSADVAVMDGVAALPATADISQWSERERALMESLGLRSEKNVQRNGQWVKEVVEAPRAMVENFLTQCRRTKLDPFARQIYMIERGGKWGIQASIDGFRLIADWSKEYRGQTEPQWCGPDGVWRDVWLSKDAPAAARIGVYRDGFASPLYAVATFDGYCPRDRDGNLKPQNQWKTNPANQLLKCAEALALRKAFPQDLSGLYTNDEMDQARTVIAKDDDEKPKAKDAPAAVSAAPAEVPGMKAWLEFKAQIDAHKTRAEFKAFTSSLDGGTVRRGIPGDAKGRTVGQYLDYAWSQLPEDAPAEPAAAEATSAAPAEPVTEWPVARIPGADASDGRVAFRPTDDEPVDAEVVDEEPEGGATDYGDDVPF